VAGGRATDQQVIAAAAFQFALAAADHDVFPVAAVQFVLAGTAAEHIVAATALDVIVASAAEGELRDGRVSPTIATAIRAAVTSTIAATAADVDVIIAGTNVLQRSRNLAGEDRKKPRIHLLTAQSLSGMGLRARRKWSASEGQPTRTRDARH